MTAALGAVPIALAAFVIQGTVQTSRAADEQHGALAVDLLFAEVRNAVSMQEVHLRHYESGGGGVAWHEPRSIVAA